MDQIADFIKQHYEVYDLKKNEIRKLGLAPGVCAGSKGMV